GSTALLPLPGTALAQGLPANARPTGGQVVAGSAAIGQTAAQTTVTQSSQRAAVDWRQFNVGSGHTVQFNQPNAQAWTLNRVTGPDPSMIAGRIQANGGVAIVNQSGVVFANGSQVSVGSLIASAANITNQNFMAGRMVFDGPARPGARVENHGTITVADRGLAALVGPRVGNTGEIRGRLARVTLTGGAETYSLDLAGDGMLAIDVTQAVRAAPSGNVALVTNSGVIEAPGGQVLISAHAASGLVEDMVRHSGRISANTDGAQTGAVAIRANRGTVRIEGTVEANGTAPGQRGGRIDVQSTGGTVQVAAGARVSASGDAGGGTVQVGGRSTRNARVEGTVEARGNGRGARGGAVAVQATESVTIAAGGLVDVAGRGGGGTALIGTEGLGRNQVMAQRTTVEQGARVAADALETGNGGTIAVNSTVMTEMRGVLTAQGGATGGDGGFVEVSAMGNIVFPDMLTQVQVGAPAGQAGTLLLDPQFIIIQSGGGAGAVTGNVAGTDPPAGTLLLTNASVSNFTGDLVLEALERITVSDAINKAQGSLTLRVTTATGGGDGIIINANVAVTQAGRVLTLESRNGAALAGTVNVAGGNLTSGGNLVLRGGVVQVANNRTLTAGGSVTLEALTTLSLGTNAIVTAGNAGAITFSGDTISVANGATIGFGGAGNGDVSMTARAAGGISIAEDVTAGTGSASLTADALSVTGGGTLVTGANITVAPFTAGRPVTISGTVANTLSLDSGTLDRLSPTTRLTI
ncbi:MAG: filamentous hemagglutinin N-terminal domain-containing protein, partial [Acetobacteraceae bacterium]|nr:filamentous hemagglutinin N-terminal domain-containing protein [Acetobacteraceae bacterium]